MVSCSFVCCVLFVLSVACWVSVVAVVVSTVIVVVVVARPECLQVTHPVT